jgi:hypothetical protein
MPALRHGRQFQPLFSQQPLPQALGGLRITADLKDFVENVAILINGTPQPAVLAVDRDHDFEWLPSVTVVGRYPN